MTSAKQNAANRANALKSTGPQTAKGLRKSSLNAIKHSLSLPVSELNFPDEIAHISCLIRPECESDEQSRELAKRIIDYERNEAYLASFCDKNAKAEVAAWGMSPRRFTLIKLAQSHRNKQRVKLTFTTENTKPKGKERVQEINFIEGFIRLQDNSLLGKVRDLHKRREAARRHQRRAINQLVKGFYAAAQSGVRNEDAVSSEQLSVEDSNV
jgi:hypothetical protein